MKDSIKKEVVRIYDLVVLKLVPVYKSCFFVYSTRVYFQLFLVMICMLYGYLHFSFTFYAFVKLDKYYFYFSTLIGYSIKILLN